MPATNKCMGVTSTVKILDRGPRMGGVVGPSFNNYNMVGNTNSDKTHVANFHILHMGNLHKFNRKAWRLYY